MLLHSHSLLHTCFTQNIDTLERRAGVPAHKIIEAHGSFATQRCIECQTPFDAEKIKKAVLSEEIEIPRCERSRCRGLVKPDIVFFGEGVCLSSRNHMAWLIVGAASRSVPQVYPQSTRCRFIDCIRNIADRAPICLSCGPCAERLPSRAN